jgi:succinate-semialdehyde dehydrogenase/glutarate-semialdehyde dehydrogenase
VRRRRPRRGCHRCRAAKFRNSGQVCTAVNRFFVHSTIADEFTERLVTMVDAMPVGAATDPHSLLGPLISANAVRRLTRVIDSAVASGARVVNSPAETPLRGHYLAPRLLRDVPDNAELVTEEIFGPVAPILTWDDTDDLVARVNSTEYGLAGYVYAADPGCARRIAEPALRHGRRQPGNDL